MPTNFYFNNFENSGEQRLIESLIIESIRIYGHDLYYIPRTAGALDEILNEDDLPQYNSAHMVEMYIKNVEGFEGQGDFLSKFGVEIRDQITFTVARYSFETEVGVDANLVRPREGDLIYFPLNRKIFKIQFVEHEEIFYQMGALQTWELRCELYEYSDERFATGVSEIDNLFVAEQKTSNTALANVETVDTLADNEEFQNEANTILDFSEKDPYSEGGSW